jgi:hypothetical protein
MKRLIPILILLLIASPAWGTNYLPWVAASSCTTAITDNYFTGTATVCDNSIGAAAANVYRGLIWQFSGSHTVCKIIVKLTKSAGDISGLNYIGELWNMSGNNLTGSPLAASANVAGSNSWSGTEVTFTFTSAHLIPSGGNYAFTIRRSDTSSDGSNYASMCYNNVNATNNWGWGRWQSDLTNTSLGSQDLYGQFYE